MVFDLLLILLLSPILFWLFTFVYTAKRGSPFVPIKTHRLETITQFIKPGDKVADLGAGDGRILIEAINKGAKLAAGWELDAFVWLRAKWNINRSPANKSKIQLHFGDFWHANLSTFNVIYLYQMTKHLGNFQTKLLPQLKKGTLIISPDYQIPGLKLHRKIKDADRGIYLYKV